MLRNKLKINDSKTEFLIIGGRKQLGKINIERLKVGEKNIVPVKSVRNLGVIFDEHLLMDKQINKICRTAYYHLRNIRAIRSYLTEDAAASLIHAFITSHLDYCNSLLNNVPACYLQKLQYVQNSAARTLLKLKKFDHIQPALSELHWLPIRYRIDFKILLLVFKALHGCAPKYIQDYIKLTGNTKYNMRSNHTRTLVVPKFKCITFGKRSFAVAGPLLWNSIPQDLRIIDNAEHLKKQLKTHLFRKFVDYGL
jgi:hypothetical protein